MNEDIASAPQPDLNGRGLIIGLLVSRYNWPVTGALLLLAQQEMERLDVASTDIHTAFVPGSYELPLAAQAMLRGQRYDALICFGCIMKGETRHDQVIGDAVAQNLQRVALDTRVPVIFGVLCAENQAQAEARIPRGIECARAAVEMARTVKVLSGSV